MSIEESATTSSPRCDKCDKEGGGDDDPLLSKCEICGIVYVCSACRELVDDWEKEHKDTCQIAQRIPYDSPMLKVCPPSMLEDYSGSKAYPKELLNIDKVFDYANRYMNNVKDVHLYLPQDKILDMYYANNDYSSGRIKLSATALENFLSRQNLNSFTMIFGETLEKEVKEMTNSGKSLRLLEQHKDLEKLCTCNLIFEDLDDLIAILNPKLKSLVLAHLTIGKYANFWSGPSAPSKLAGAVSNLTQLVKLNFHDCLFSDEDMEPLLSQLVNLRSLVLTGCFGETLQGGSLLTDAGLISIAMNCPNLQSLDLSFHAKASTVGVRAILEKCQHLRELRVPRLRIKPEDLPGLVLLSPRLLLLTLSIGGYKLTDEQQQCVNDAIKVTAGRTLLCSEMIGLIKIPKEFPKEIHDEAARSKSFVEQAQERLDDPDILNEWDFIIVEQDRAYI